MESIIVNKLGRFPSAVARDLAVDAWFDGRRPPLGAIAREGFLRMRNCGSDVQEHASNHTGRSRLDLAHYRSSDVD